MRKATDIANTIVKIIPEKMPEAVEEILVNSVEISENFAITSRKANDSWFLSLFLGLFLS